jgi:hypothetical protein
MDADKQKKIRRRIEDALRKQDDEEILLRIAELLKVKTD